MILVGTEKQVPMELRANKVPLELRDLQDLQVPRDLRVTKEPRENEERASRVNAENRECPVCREATSRVMSSTSPDPRGLPELTETPALKELPGSRDRREKMG